MNLGWVAPAIRGVAEGRVSQRRSLGEFAFAIMNLGWVAPAIRGVVEVRVSPRRS